MVPTFDIVDGGCCRLDLPMLDTDLDMESGEAAIDLVLDMAGVGCCDILFDIGAA